jgi:hypothetical protein
MRACLCVLLPEKPLNDSLCFDNGLIIVAKCLTLHVIWTFQAVGQFPWSTKRGGKQMCLWAVRHVRFERLTGKQKTNLKRKLQQRKKVVQGQLNDVNAALRHVARKSKGRAVRGRR